MPSPLVPVFPTALLPAMWDTLTLLAATIFLEAEGETDEGKLAVGWVIRNRANGGPQDPHRVMLSPYQFSCWNADYAKQAMTRLSHASGAIIAACWRAAVGSLWRLLPDPTSGATFYLNVESTKAARPNHDLPIWAADPADPTRVDLRKVTVVIGRHHFLRA